MSNKLNSKQKKLIKVVVIILLFVYNLAVSSYIFFYYTVGQVIAYLFDCTFPLGKLFDSANQAAMFSSIEHWLLFVLISSILFLGVFIAYIVLSIKSIKNDGITKKLCVRSAAFTFVYTALYFAPFVIMN